jgi:protein TonB
MKSNLTASLAAAVCLHAVILIGLDAMAPAVPQPVSTESDPVDVTFIDLPPAPVTPPTAVPAEPAPTAVPFEPQSTPEPPQPTTPVTDMPPPFPAPIPSRDTLPIPTIPATPSAPRHIHTRVPHSAPGRAVALAHKAGSGSQGTPAHSLSNPRPIYPEMARHMHQQGVVLLDVLVSTDGAPVDISVARSSGFPLLDRAAMEAVRRWTFDPARSVGIPIMSRVQLPVRFSLED